MDEKTIVALEIGSSKIKGALGIVDANNTLSVKAVEEEKITDNIVRYGCVINVVETVKAVRTVLDRLEQRTNHRKVKKVYINIGGRSLKSDCIDIERHFPMETEITRGILDEMKDEALSRPFADRDVVGALTREVRIDNTLNPRPVGVMGRHIITRNDVLSCRSQLLKNIVQVLELRLNLKIKNMFVRPLAEADLVTTTDEKRLGCMFVDFGAETTSVAIYKQGVLVHLAVLPMGSHNITLDIATLNILEERAEEYKIQYGNASGPETHQVVRPIENVDLETINLYVGARAGEILLNVVEQIKYAGLETSQLAGGVVVTGGGSRLGGLTKRLEEMLGGVKVRIGTPDNRVHILDGRIQSAEAVDVIAILAAATRKGAEECLEPLPQPASHPTEQPAATASATTQYQYPHRGNTPRVTPTPQTEPAPKKEVAASNPTQPEKTASSEKSARRKSLFGDLRDTIRNRVASILTDNLYEESDDNDDEDEN